MRLAADERRTLRGAGANVDADRAARRPRPRARNAALLGLDGGGGDAGSVTQKTAARKYSAGDDEDDRLGAGDLDDQRPEQREPDRERRVEGQREDAVRREQLAARDEDRDHRELGRGEEDGDRSRRRR